MVENSGREVEGSAISQPNALQMFLEYAVGQRLRSQSRGRTRTARRDTDSAAARLQRERVERLARRPVLRSESGPLSRWRRRRRVFALKRREPYGGGQRERGASGSVVRRRRRRRTEWNDWEPVLLLEHLQPQSRFARALGRGGHLPARLPLLVS